MWTRENRQTSCSYPHRWARSHLVSACYLSDLITGEQVHTWCQRVTWVIWSQVSSSASCDRSDLIQRWSVWTCPHPINQMLHEVLGLSVRDTNNNNAVSLCRQKEKAVFLLVEQRVWSPWYQVWTDPSHRTHVRTSITWRKKKKKAIKLKRNSPPDSLTQFCFEAPAETGSWVSSLQDVCAACERPSERLTGLKLWQLQGPDWPHWWLTSPGWAWLCCWFPVTSWFALYNMESDSLPCRKRLEGYDERFPQTWPTAQKKQVVIQNMAGRRRDSFRLELHIFESLH